MFGPATDDATLVAFYRKVRPFGPGWKRIRRLAGDDGVTGKDARDNIPLALLGWFVGCTVIWSSLFTVGNMLYGRWDHALMLLAIFVVSGAVLISIVRRLWTAEPVTIHQNG
jgi:hypothetical protein